MYVVDLSMPLRSGMPVYPGDPEVSIAVALTVPEDGVAVTALSLGSHSGTHLDAPTHVIPGGRSLSEIPLEWLVGPAVILRAPDARADDSLCEDDIAGGLPQTLPTIVCVATGWDRLVGNELMYRNPYLSVELAAELWARGARVLGVDMFSPDRTMPADRVVPDLPGGNAESAGGSCLANTEIPVHQYWLSRGGVIVENLVGLERVPDKVGLSLLPIAIAEGDGAPIRAVAILPAPEPGPEK
ncbi:cyclase family protein [Leucobacter sp. 7(1)]|uniref:cyclase family protein n=1 Tax=Leucobacter sp. 7(1) TaxID=1255613 RepID=UPI000B354839|nr:cyclase family protein [Leucobacter sp. 7(1)]